VTTTVFLHGSGLGGADGWPVQAAAARPTWQFLSRHPDGDLAERDAGRIIEVLTDSGGAGHVVASSYGGNAAVIALQRRPDVVAALVLAEPATFDLARGTVAVEEHIEAMQPAAIAADDPALSDREWSDLFAAGFGREPLDDEQLAVLAPRMRPLPPPWSTGIDAARGLPGRCLVVTGGPGPRPLFEQTAEALEHLGARRLVLPGAGHRVQDDPAFNAAVTDFLAQGAG
jgi:pimeloyl-ACP methyl ester carboxylesterase